MPTGKRSAARPHPTNSKRAQASWLPPPEASNESAEGAGQKSDSKMSTHWTPPTNRTNTTELTTNAGVGVPNNDHSLTLGPRGARVAGHIRCGHSTEYSASRTCVQHECIIQAACPIDYGCRPSAAGGLPPSGEAGTVQP